MRPSSPSRQMRLPTSHVGADSGEWEAADRAVALSVARVGVGRDGTLPLFGGPHGRDAGDEEENVLPLLWAER